MRRRGITTCQAGSSAVSRRRTAGSSASSAKTRRNAGLSCAVMAPSRR
ncbi:MAG: hypothetical protein IPF99_10480 [Deltaproteobacteria bacterium]|nr:hypothetical protein [Deltaproteobacteria bacterium]